MHKIVKPTLIVNLSTCKSNILQMNQKCKNSKVVFRPHFKTHQSIQVGQLFNESGINQITVSSVDMALQFASLGWRDITIAFPVNILQIDDLNYLASNIKLTLVVENVEAIKYLSRHLKHSVNLLIKIDVGYGRTGIKHSNTNVIDTLVKVIKSDSYFNFIGFLAHFGNTYNATSSNEIRQIYTISMGKILELKQKYPEAYFSIGDTPSCSVVDKFEYVSEIRPGNFVYYDAFQLNIGACNLNQIAATMACPIVAKHSNRNELVIHGGAVHFSKDNLKYEPYGTIFGLVINKSDSKIELEQGVYLKKLSQEHGTLTGPSEWVSKCKVGDIIHIIPIHSCLTANLMKENTIYI